MAARCTSEPLVQRPRLRYPRALRPARPLSLPTLALAHHHHRTIFRLRVSRHFTVPATPPDH